MRGVLKFFAFLLGLLLGVAALVGVNVIVRGIWMPLAFSMLVSALIYNQEWLRKRKIAGAISLALVFGVCGGWLDSNDQIASQGHIATIAKGLTALSVAFFLVLVVRAATLAPKMRAAAWWMVVLVLVACMVAVGSSSAGSAHRMEQFMIHTLHMAPAQVDAIVPIFRKCFHFTFYGIGGWFAWRAAHAAGVPSRNRWLFGLSVILLLATFDEVRQSTVADRGASQYDVMIDVAGAATFIFFSELMAGKRGGRRKA